MNTARTYGGAALLVLFLLAGAESAAAQVGSGEPLMLPEPKESKVMERREGLPADAYIAEVIDSTFFVGPAEFFALDLPMRAKGVVAKHLFGTIRATGGSRDIVVRLFRGEAYDRWLKRRGGDKAGPFFISPKSKSITLDHELPAGEKVVLLLDNGYSIRTPKRVHCQLQIHYQRDDGVAVPPRAHRGPRRKADGIGVRRRRARSPKQRGGGHPASATASARRREPLGPCVPGPRSGVCAVFAFAGGAVRSPWSSCSLCRPRRRACTRPRTPRRPDPPCSHRAGRRRFRPSWIT
jgi:hypothetical protein